MKLTGQINSEGEIALNPRTKEYLKGHKNVPVEIELQNRESDELRAYFEGGVVRTFFWLHPHSGWETFEEARDELKYMFNGYDSHDREGKRVKRVRSTVMSKKKWESFLKRIEQWFMENGYEQWWPNPGEYKKWRDSGPMKGEEFWMHAELKKLYLQEKEKSVPMWRR